MWEFALFCQHFPISFLWNVEVAAEAPECRYTKFKMVNSIGKFLVTHWEKVKDRIHYFVFCLDGGWENCTTHVLGGKEPTFENTLALHVVILKLKIWHPVFRVTHTQSFLNDLTQMQICSLVYSIRRKTFMRKLRQIKNNVYRGTL